MDFIILSMIGMVLIRNCECEGFTSSPGVVKTDPGIKVVMRWTLSKSFDPKAFYASLKVYKTDNNKTIISYGNKDIPCNTSRDSRLDCVLPKTTGRIVGFSITSVRDSDAGQYKIGVTHDINSRKIEDNNGFVYVFNSPVVQVSGSHETTEGNSITLTCKATSRSLPVSLRYTAKMVYTWTINNPEGNHVVNGNQVTIQTTNKGNQGSTFTCVVKEDGSSLTGRRSVTLNILYAPGKPQIRGVPKQALIEDKDRLSVTCQLSGDDLGNPQVNHYVWRNVNSSYSRDTGSTNKLVLSSVNAKQHDGTWQCQPKNSVGQGQLTDFKVIVNAQPSVTTDLPNKHDTINTDNLSVNCSFKAKPAAYITWIYADNNSLPEAVTYTENHVNIDRVYTQTTSTLSWHQQAALDDPRRRQAGGRYKCHAVNTVGYRDSGNMELNVLYAPGKPHIRGVPTQALIEDRDRLSVTCQLSGDDLGNPQVNHYVWRNENSSYSRDTGSNNTLILSSVNAKQHDGIWQCQPNNSVGQGQLTQFMIVVNAQPSVRKDLPNTHDTINTDSLSVSCSFKAKPAANITWIYEDNNNLPEAITYTENHVNIDRVYTQTTSTLSWHQQVALGDPRRRHAGGRYKCHAVNTVGYRDSGNMELKVSYAPYDIKLNTSQLTATEGDLVTVQCTSDCNPTCRFTWTRQQDKTWSVDDYLLTLSDISREYNDIFTCQAENKYGAKMINLQIIVNFAPEIISFVPSTSGDIIQNNTLNITCEVSSRPKSSITITNNNTSDIILSVSNTHKAVYTFDRVHVLDSGVYQCSAINGIKPLTDVTRQMTLDVKGGYDLCEKPPTEEGLPLKANMTISFCLSANPFTEITTNNWMFSSKESNNTIHGLPDGVLTSIQDTSHPYKKYAMLVIPAVNKNHFGVYTLKVKNNYNTKEVTHVFNLLPEGPPVPPTELRITYITAVSIYLEWMAGFDGGPAQTFWLYVFDKHTSDWFIISNISDTSKGQGGVIEYKLTQEQGVVPDHQYNIHVGAINSISNVTGDSVMTHTKALPHFEGDEPEIVYNVDTAEITWPINNLDSVTSILIDVCVSDRNICNSTVNITSPDIQPYIIPLPEQDTKTYVLTFTFYDGNDIVYTQSKHLSLGFSGGKLLLPTLVSGILGVLVVTGIVITLVILWRKGYFTKAPQKQKTSKRLKIDRETAHTSAAFTNPALDITEDSDNEINPYDTMSFSQSNTSVHSEQDTKCSAEKVQKGKVGPVNGDIYAEVNKTKLQASSGIEQSDNANADGNKKRSINQPDPLPKPKGNTKTEEKTTQRRVNRASVFPPETTTSSPQSGIKLYAQVMKKRKKDEVDIREKKEPRKLIGGKKGNALSKGLNVQKSGRNNDVEEQKPYINVLNNSVQDGTYSEVQICGDRVCQIVSKGDDQYANIGKSNAERRLQFVGPDGIIYADLEIINKPPADPDVIHGKDQLVEYASIDISKLQKQ